MQLPECGLELHPDKPRIVYCPDVNTQGAYPRSSSRSSVTLSGREGAEALDRVGPRRARSTISTADATAALSYAVTHYSVTSLQSE
jgi:hypothetical protein